MSLSFQPRRERDCLLPLISGWFLGDFLNSVTNPVFASLYWNTWNDFLPGRELRKERRDSAGGQAAAEVSGRECTKETHGEGQCAG